MVAMVCGYRGAGGGISTLWTGAQRRLRFRRPQRRILRAGIKRERDDMGRAIPAAADAEFLDRLPHRARKRSGTVSPDERAASFFHLRIRRADRGEASGVGGRRRENA